VNYDHRSYSLRGFPVPQRRLEDRIQTLAAKAVATQDPAELNDIIHQLRAALREHADRLRKLAAEKLIAGLKMKGSAVVSTEDAALDEVGRH
jgi:hypothetical protein